MKRVLGLGDAIELEVDQKEVLWKPIIEKFIPKWLESMNFIFQSGSSDYANIL